MEKSINLYVTVKELNKVKDSIEDAELLYIGAYLYQIGSLDYEFASFGESFHEIVNIYPEPLDKIIESNKDNNCKFCIKLKKVGDNWEIE